MEMSSYRSCNALLSIWVVLKLKSDRRLTLDTEFRGEPSAL